MNTVVGGMHKFMHTSDNSDVIIAGFTDYLG